MLDVLPQTVDDVAALGTEIFGSDTDPRIKKLKVHTSQENSYFV